MPVETIHAAIQTVLRNGGQPMTAREIHAAIVSEGLYEFHARQPQHVVLAQLRRRCTNVAFPSAAKQKLFTRTEDGRYRLADPAHKNVATQAANDSADSRLKDLHALHAQHLRDTTDEIIRQIRQLSPKQFERFTRHLLLAYGFRDVVVTRYSRDGGIDGHGRLPVGMAHLHVAFQSKHWRQSVGRPDVDRFRGAIQGRFEQGVLVTPSTFTSEALDVSFVAGAVPVVLLDGTQIANIVVAKGLGLETQTLLLYSFSVDVLIDDAPARSADPTAAKAASGPRNHLSP